MVGSASAHHPEYVKPERVVIQCIDSDNSMNQIRNKEATSRRSEDQKVLVQWQKCYEV